VLTITACSVTATWKPSMLQVKTTTPQTKNTSNDFKQFIIGQWAFTGIGTILVGTWLMYKMRIVERRYGSAKYIVKL
jgi:cell division protein FtsW (lipid II flippase)